MLEAELSRRNIPFHKYGGLKFVETAHVKDLLAFLRLAENPRDTVAGLRILPLLPGVGPRKAQNWMKILLEAGGDFRVWEDQRPPAASETLWPAMVRLLASLAASEKSLSEQIHQTRTFYAPLLEQLYDNPQPRARDLEQLEQVAGRYRDRRTMLAELTLDPPSSTQDLAGPPLLDDDYLVLSTIHSAKGLEWDAVYVIHATDGNLPSDMATGSPEEIEEERRLFYVALTRAKNWLYVACPLRYYYARTRGDRHGYAQRTRFITDEVAACFDHRIAGEPGEVEGLADDEQGATTSEAIRRKTKGLW